MRGGLQYTKAPLINEFELIRKEKNLSKNSDVQDEAVRLIRIGREFDKVSLKDLLLGIRRK